MAKLFRTTALHILASGQLSFLGSTLATRGDLQALEKTLHTDVERLDHKLIEHDGEFKTIKWMLGIIVGGIVMLVLKAFFPA